MEAEVIYGGLKNTTFVTVYLHSKAKLHKDIFIFRKQMDHLSKRILNWRRLSNMIQIIWNEQHKWHNNKYFLAWLYPKPVATSAK